MMDTYPYGGVVPVASGAGAGPEGHWMELRQLRYFVAVAETCHFGQAAERLLIAQPALSQAIRALEHDLGVTLFNRTTRHVSLTPAGDYFLDESRRILAAVEDSTRGVRQLADGRHGLVRMGLVGTAATSHLPHIVRTLKRELPEVAVEIKGDILTPELCDQLRSGALDVAVLRPPVVGENIATHVLEEEPLVLAVAKDHPLALTPALGIDDLRTETFVGYAAQESAVNQAVLHACRTAGFVPHRAHMAPGTSVLLALVAAGLGVALVPASARAFALSGVSFRDITDVGTIQLALGWCSERPRPVVDSVIAVLAADRELASLSDTFIGGVLP